MSTVDPNLLQALVEGAPEGVAICEAASGHWHVIYANAALQQLTGYNADAILGRSLSFLQAADREQEGINRIREALREGRPCRTTVRNYRSDGTQFLNDIMLAPLRNPEGQITHYASFHREAGAARMENRGEARDPSMSTQTMLAYLRDDKLTGLLRRPYFEELIRRDWGLAQRESRRLSFLVFDLDDYSQYRDVFGRQGADQSFRRIARVIGGCFRRASDLCGRFEEDQIAALTTGLDLSQAARLAEAVLARVRDLSIHHPRSSVSRYVTVSAGVVSLVPPHDAAPGRLYEAALRALKDAKELGKNRVMSREAE
ncbi:MAG TPA: diguanylate cyclase [Povalibacter sp.]|jgi:diguanylate cyclase (GGDEF)-like protein/PAS domain S-box-containing protein|nr:diguanylate cyclase [Povalibacter sp.]